MAQIAALIARALRHRDDDASWRARAQGGRRALRPVHPLSRAAAADAEGSVAVQRTRLDTSTDRARQEEDGGWLARGVRTR